MKSVVDELIMEVAGEVDKRQEVADAFAFDLLVAAVAFSQGKYDFGVSSMNVKTGGHLCHRRLAITFA